MLRAIALCGGLLLVVSRYRFAASRVRELESAWPHSVELGLMDGGYLTFQVPMPSKPSSARPDFLGRVLGRLRRFNASQAAILRRLGANGTEESNSGSTASGSSPRGHPIRDY